MEEIFDIFSDSVSQLVLFSLDQQALNNPIPMSMKASLEGVLTASVTMCTVARDTSKLYEKYPDLKAEILECCTQVDTSNATLKAITETIDEEKKDDVKEDWDNLVNGCKGIAKETAKLLVIVYGSPAKRVLQDVVKTREAVQKLLNEKSEPEDLVSNTNAVSPLITTLAESVSFLAGQDLPEEQKEQLNEDFESYNALNQKLVNSVNVALAKPGDEECLEAMEKNANKLLRLIANTENEALSGSENGNPYDSFEDSLERRLEQMAMDRLARLHSAETALRNTEAAAGAKTTLYADAAPAPVSENAQKSIDSAATLEATGKEMETAALDESADPQILADLAKKSMEQSVEVAQNYRNATVEEIERSQAALKTTFDGVNHHNTVLIEKANAVIGEPTSAEKKKEMEEECDAVEALVKETVAALLPSNKHAFDALDEKAQEEILEAQAEAEALIMELNNLREATREERPARVADAVQKATTHLVGYAEKTQKAVNSRNRALQEDCQAAALKVQDTTPLIASHVNAVIANPGDAAARAALAEDAKTVQTLGAEVQENIAPHECVLAAQPAAQPALEPVDGEKPMVADHSESLKKINDCIEHSRVELAALHTVLPDDSVSVQAKSAAATTASASIAHLCESLAAQAQVLPLDSEDDKANHAMLLDQYRELQAANDEMVNDVNKALRHPNDPLATVQAQASTAKALEKVQGTEAGVRALEPHYCVVPLAQQKEEAALPDDERAAKQAAREEEHQAQTEALALARAKEDAAALREALDALAKLSPDDPGYAGAQALVASRALRLQESLAAAKAGARSTHLSGALKNLQDSFGTSLALLVKGLSTDPAERAQLTPDSAMQLMENLADIVLGLNKAQAEDNERRERAARGEPEEPEPAVAEVTEKVEEVAIVEETTPAQAPAEEAAAEEVVVEEVYMDEPVEPEAQAPTEEKIEYHANIINTAVAKNKEISQDEVRILESSNTVSMEMANMAQAYKNRQRQELIMSARNISSQIAVAIAEAKAIAADCGDGVLKRQVMTGVQAMKNFSVQLKIIASVKAASMGAGLAEEDDEEQLLACCEGLSRAMASTMSACHSAKIVNKFVASVRSTMLVNKFFKKVRSKALSRKK